MIRRCYTKPNIVTTATLCSQIAPGDLSTDTPTVQNIYDGKGLAQQQSPNYAKGKIELFIGGTLPTRAMFETTPVYDENGNPVEPEPYPEGTPKPTPLANTWENLEGGRPNNSNTSHRPPGTERGLSVLICPITGMPRNIQLPRKRSPNLPPRHRAERVLYFSSVMVLLRF